MQANLWVQETYGINPLQLCKLSALRLFEKEMEILSGSTRFDRQVVI